MSYEIEIDDCIIDNGYGDQDATIVVDVSPVITDESFTAHNEAGILQNYGGRGITDIEVLGGTAFLIGNNGVELGEMELDSETVLKHVTKDSLLETLNQRHGDSILKGDL